MADQKQVDAYISYLEDERCKANDFGKKCQRVDNDFASAQRWYSIAEAFKMAKEKAIEMLGLNIS